MARFSTSTLLSLLALSASAFAQRSLTDALGSQSDLSAFVGLVSRFPDLVSSVSSSGGTVLAPSNSALTTFISSLGPQGIAGVSNDTVRAILTYHVLPETLRASNLTVKGGAAAETSLQGEDDFANFEGDDTANVVFASAFGSTGLQGNEAGPLRIYSGVGNPANVTTADVEYDGGVVHVIASVLNLPQNASTTAQTAGLTNLVTALTRAELVSAVDETPSLTIFAPSNEAFAALGVDLNTISATDLGNILKYHVIAGTVAYSSVLADSQDVETLSGESVNVAKRDGKIFVNDAEVVQANVILNNGVVHVINKVLTPTTTGDTSPSGGGSTSRRPTNPTNSAGGSQPSGEAEDDGAALGLKSSLFGMLAAVGAALTLL